MLQAASRCLRQVPGNNTPARIYLSSDNRSALDKELRENYGETLTDITHVSSKSRGATIRLRKLDIPPLLVKQLIRTVVRKENVEHDLNLNRPEVVAETAMQITRLTLGDRRVAKSILQQAADTVEVATMSRTVDLYSAAVELAAIYRLDMWTVLGELRRIYDGENELPISHLSELQEQIEAQTCKYEVREEEREVALALVKPDGFEKTLDTDGTEIYTAEISYPISKEHLLAKYEEWQTKSGALGFHYSPYNFDSGPELSFFEQVLDQLGVDAGAVEDIYFTGALTDARKTDFRVEYKGEDGRWHDYTPDFVIRCRDGKCLIVEIKSTQFKAATEEDLERDARGGSPITVEGRKAIALKRWTQLDPKQLKYEIIFASQTVDYDQLAKTRDFVKKC